MSCEAHWGGGQRLIRIGESDGPPCISGQDFVLLGAEFRSLALVAALVIFNIPGPERNAPKQKAEFRQAEIFNMRRSRSRKQKRRSAESRHAPKQKCAEADILTSRKQKCAEPETEIFNIHLQYSAPKQKRNFDKNGPRSERPPMSIYWPAS